jgi:hypothetical protein
MKIKGFVVVQKDKINDSKYILDATLGLNESGGFTSTIEETRFAKEEIYSNEHRILAVEVEVTIIGKPIK